MTDRVVFWEQARQDRQNNSVKHPETEYLFIYFK